MAVDCIPSPTLELDYPLVKRFSLAIEPAIEFAMKLIVKPIALLGIYFKI